MNESKWLAVCFMVAALIFSLPNMGVATVSMVDRLKPVANPCIAGDPCSGVKGEGSSKVASSRSSKSIYQNFCSACHESGVLNAPRKGDANDWERRLAQAGGHLSDLVKIAEHGIRSMPAKGTCGDCTDQELESAITYMSDIKPSKKNK